MKKVILSAALLMAGAFSAQMNMSEDFEDKYEGDLVAQDWSFTGANDWSFYLEQGMICQESRMINQEISSLSSPSNSIEYASTESNGDAISISFKYAVLSLYGGTIGGTFTIQYSADGGSNWTNLGNVMTFDSEITCATHTLNIPQGAIPSGANFKLKMSFQDTGNNNEWKVLIDDFTMSQGTLSAQDIAVKDLKNVQAYPNPFKDVVNISDIKGVESIAVVDMVGKTVKYLKPSKQLHLGDLQSGMYFINLSYKGGKVKTLKSIKR